ncbi:MAG TPA: diguanylate cyclase [Candidatus Acidoferrales bacterium]|nr:diguanylate cyclase [Candidatus Acidoferrales bacterium]
MLAATALMAALYGYVYTYKKQIYLLLWSAGWALLAIHYAGFVFRDSIPQGPFQSSFSLWLVAAAALVFFLSAQLYVQSQPWVYPIGGAAAFFAVWGLLYAQEQFPFSPGFGIAVVFIAAGVLFWRGNRKRETLADSGLGMAFGLWGALGLANEFAGHNGTNANVVLGTLTVVPLIFTAVLMAMALYEEEKRRMEGHMLALSNLNLATSGVMGSEVQRMLAQALDRILNVVRIPSGALFLHHGDPLGPTSVVAVGLSESFCSVSQQDGLDDHLVELVVRLGGLAVFRDLHRDALWKTLEGEKSFQRFRQLALQQGLRTVAAISLQTKERAFGVLLLGTPDSRRFTPPELHLLLALGHQIGMAVENSYLIQQTSRRSEELNILNEIGRVLSSTLDTDNLFEKIYTEMQRLLDASNLYIAFFDASSNMLRFELEIRDGAPQPKRTRAGGNHLSEYIIKNRQPLLIRENVSQEARRLGVEPLMPMGCFCAVPLVLYDRAVGVMAVLSRQERAFDDGHLELMRVLASEATIALENARLFRGEQIKSRHLTLLNNISRNTIATLNPDEMLARIATELESGLTYDHISIGLLDYVAKEVVIQAQAGKRKDAEGHRIRFGEGLVGRVARTGEIAVVRDFTADNSLGAPLLEGSASAVVLPIVYGDQLHGVLCVETAELCDFTVEQLQLLETLADLISGALHGAISFQKAQEQAITDGLTGVKTHRYFMETLSAEWKRATRAGRPFSVVLIDLDRFKFVNDFYGHLEGDLVLRRVGQILEENCRRSDIVARYGGDEYVVLMPETNAEQSRQLAGKLRTWICSDPLLREKNVTGSFGIATFPVHGSTPQELIQVADASMYLSKHQGGNAVSTADHFDPNEAKRWKRDVLEAYLGVTLKKQFTTGPAVLEEICSRLDQFTRSLEATEITNSKGTGMTFSATALNNEVPSVPLPQPVIETLTSLVTAVDSKDPFTNNHSQKVSSYAFALADAMDLDTSTVDEIRFAALLHDLGKVGIAETVLNKNGPLDSDEWELMKQHVEFGARILEKCAGLESICAMVRHHHEFFDGSGYPEGLSGEKIPLGARVIAIADAYDTITSERTYKRPRPAEEALAELERCGGSQFDPELVTLFLRAMRRLPSPIFEITSGAEKVVVAGPTA